MGYVKASLVPGETVLRRGLLHWMWFLPRLFWTGVFTAAGVAVYVLAGSIAAKLKNQVLADRLTNVTEAQVASVIGWIGVGFAGLQMLRLAGFIMHAMSHEYAVTSRRIIMKRGVIRRSSLELMLKELESVGIDQTIMGRLFGYGTIHIRGTGGHGSAYRYLSQPMKFKKAAETAKFAPVAEPKSAARRGTEDV